MKIRRELLLHVFELGYAVKRSVTGSESFQSFLLAFNLRLSRPGIKGTVTLNRCPQSSVGRWALHVDVGHPTHLGGWIVLSFLPGIGYS